MPRKARQKNIEAIYHIMCRGISEILLFKDTMDKNCYLRLLKNCADKYKCSVYAYCLMNTHLHIHLDPKGYDISKFMHSINTSYVLYYNKKYRRHGHVFQERFKSKILNSDRYNLAVSAYIHNNPKDIVGYKNREQEYEYSSFGIYLGVRKDKEKIIDKSFIQGLMGSSNKNSFVRKYYKFVLKQKEVDGFDKFVEENIESTDNEYISGRKIVLRETAPEKVIAYISAKLGLKERNILLSLQSKELSENRAFTAYVLRVLCGLGYRQICETICNITISGCSRLCKKGYDLSNQINVVYHKIFNELLDFSII